MKDSQIRYILCKMDDRDDMKRVTWAEFENWFDDEGSKQKKKEKKA